MARKQIKKRTYHNMITIYNALIVKGWGHEETLKMTHRFFDAIEEYPQGHSIWWYVDMVIDNPEPIKATKLSYR